jgi:hypothetical protein
MDEKPIKRRKRIKHTLSLNERLQIFAEQARQRALQNPPGAQRESMLIKARIAKNVADMVSD